MHVNFVPPEYVDISI